MRISRVTLPVRIAVLVSIVGTVLLGAWRLVIYTEVREMQRLETLGYERLSLYISSVRSAIERYRYLPFILARDKNVMALMRGGPQGNDERVDVVNRYLERTNFEADALTLFIMDRNGTTIASSNWREPMSFVGEPYPWQPYFSDAMKAGEASFFGISWTDGEPGYFLSRAIEIDGKRVGVAVVNINIVALELDWLSGGEIVAMSDSNGVIFLSSVDGLKYRTLKSLSEQALNEIERTRQYHSATLKPLEWKTLSASRGMHSIVSIPVLDRRKQTADEQTSEGAGKYMHQSLLLADYKWRLHFFSSLKPVKTHVANVVWALGAALLLLTLALLYFDQRRRTIRAKLEGVSELERRVDERTRDLVRSNIRLTQEIEERERAEGELAEAQECLVQASKLAALGQMSAAIAHEINQPLTAIQTFVSSARLFVKRRNYMELASNLDSISSMADRMASITGQLKDFARRSSGQKEVVHIQEAIRNAFKLSETRLRHAQVSVEMDLVDDDLTAIGNEIRLEQVIINLVNNAIDAIETVKTKELTCELRREGDSAVMVISDSGCGFDRKSLSRVFEPFFTTKQVATRLGLGLSISYAIIEQMGGTIEARKNAKGGASFEVRLPLLRKRDREARQLVLERDNV